MTGRGKKLKICHIVATTEGGRWCYEQLRELRDVCGHEVTAILPPGEGALVRLLREAKIRQLTADISLYGANHNEFTSTWPQKIKALCRLLERERFDVVQTHLLPALVLGRSAAWLADVPVRLDMIAAPYYLMAKLPHRLDKWSNWMASAVIPSCHLSRDLYRAMGVPEDRMPLIYYGPDAGRFDPRTIPRADLRTEMGWPQAAPIVIMVSYFYGRMPESNWVPPDLWGKATKGHEDLILAANIVLREFPETRFVLVGDGFAEPGREFLEEMRALVSRLGLTERVIFPGARADYRSLYLDATVSVQAPLNDNPGGSIESLLLERPLVATRAGGMVDTVKDGQTGVLVEPENPASLAEGILRFLRDPEFAARMGRQGRAFMLESFTLATAVTQLNQLYQQQARAAEGRYRPIVRLARYAIAMPLIRGLAALDGNYNKYLIRRMTGMHLIGRMIRKLRKLARGG